MTLTIVKDNAIYNILKFLLYKKVQNAKSVICEPPETECVFVLMFSGAAQSQSEQRTGFSPDCSAAAPPCND